MKARVKIRQIIGILLSFLLVVGLMPGMRLKALAGEPTPYASLVGTTTTVTFNEMPWYIIADKSTSLDAGTVTLLAANDSFGRSAFKADYSSNSYNNSDVKAYLESVVAGTAGVGKPNFKNVADAIKPVTLTTYAYNSTTVVAEETTDAKLYLLSTSEAETCANLISAGYWWLRSPGNNDNNFVQAAVVAGGNVSTNGAVVLGEYDVRPALELDLSKVSFDDETKTFRLLSSYPLYVGGTQVTNANAANIDGNGKVAYDAATRTLTLNGYSYSYSGSLPFSEETRCGIYWTDTQNLNIVLKGNNKLDLWSGNYTQYAIKATKGSVVISGDGTLDASGRDDVLNTAGTLTIKSGNINLSANRGCGINTSQGLVIDGGKLTAASEQKAIEGTVKNTIAGTGWTNRDGTKGETFIEVNTAGQSLATYKKVQFPAETSSQNTSDSGSTDTTDTGSKVPYEDVPIESGYVKDITGTAAATAESNPFETKIENNSELKNLLSLTDAEVAEGVNVWLDIQDIGSGVSKKDKSLVQNASDDYTVGMYLDINLFKKVGSNAATKITETNGKIKASILIPKSLRKSGRTLALIRVHDGVAKVISGTYDEDTHIFTFETDKFSTYAIAYKDAASSTESESSDSSSSTGSTSTGSTSTGSATTTATAPKTGDANDMRLWCLLVLAVFAGVGFFEFSRRKRVNK